MILGIDLIGTNLESGTKTFNINYLNQIVRKENKEKIYVFVCKNYLKNLKTKKIPKNIKLLKKPNFLSHNILKILWMQLFLPIQIKIYGINKLYSPMNYCPLFCKFMNVQIYLNIHTNLPWVYFDKMPGNKVKNYLIKNLMYYSIITCNKLIVNSYFAKKEIYKKLKINPNKIFVNYLAVNNKTISVKENEKKFNSNFDFNSKYILSVSSCVKYHDFFNILKAFKKIKESKNKLKLVLVIQPLDKNYFTDIKKYVHQNFNKNEVYFFHNINTNLINKLYKRAMLYIFSSFSEVFGLTSLEAMKNNCPVLISNCSALPEINGDAALYFDPRNSKDIENKINKLISNNFLRRKLVKKGSNHIKKFKWERTFNNLMRIIKD